MSRDEDLEWLKRRLPADPLPTDPLVLRTLAGVRSRSTPTPVRWGWPTLAMGLAGASVWLLLPTVEAPRPLSAYVVLEDQDEDADEEFELADDEDDTAEMEPPAMMEMGLDDLSEEELAAFSRRLKLGPRS